MSRPTTEELITRFAPVLDRIGSGAAQRESRRELAHEAVALLAESGFTALRVPAAYGGTDIGVDQLFILLARLGEADSNLVQALRAHFATVEAYRLADHTQQELWFPRVAAGQIFGNATTEKGNLPGTNQTVLTRRDGNLLLNGTKYYSTGSLYADWIKVHADLLEGGSVRVTVHRDDAGVQLEDDWDGFGQRLTASGTSRFNDVVADPDHVVPYAGQSASGTFTALVQLILLAALTGTGRAVRRDAIDYVRTRTRAFAHGVGTEVQRDPLVQETVGRISAKVFAAEAAFHAAAAELAAVLEREARGTLRTGDAVALNLLVSQAQLVVAQNVLEVANELFEVGGASATSSTRSLDRHWRNARVLSSHNPLSYRAREIGQQHLTADANFGIVYVGASTPTTGSHA